MSRPAAAGPRPGRAEQSRRMSKAQGRYIVGVDVGGTSIKCALIDPSDLARKRAVILGRAKASTDAHEGTEATIARVHELAHEACAEAGVRFGDVAALGVAAAGAVDHQAGVVLKAVNLGWEKLPLARMLRERTDRPVEVENDVRAAVYGEQRAGAARGFRDIFGVWVGTGIGGGLILDDELYFGHFGTAGEFGRGVVLPWAPPGEGSLEQVCSRTGISETIVRLLRSNRESIIERPESRDPTEVRTGDIAKAFEKGDPLVREVVEHAAAVLGIAIAGIATLLSLEAVILGGGLVDGLGEGYVEIVARNIERGAFPDALKEIKVVSSSLSDDAGPVGAALLAARRWGIGASRGG
jgi:glucokinase